MRKYEVGDLVVLSREEIEFVAHEHLDSEPELDEMTDEQWYDLHRGVLNEYLFGIVIELYGPFKKPIVQWMPQGHSQIEEPNKLTLFSQERDSANYQERYQS